MKAAYETVAPDPRQLPHVAAKVSALLREFPGWQLEALRNLRTPVMIVIGDHDFIRPEHAVGMLRLFPHSQLAVIPNAGHDAITERPQQVFAAIVPFLSTPAAQRASTPDKAMR